MSNSYYYYSSPSGEIISVSGMSGYMDNITVFLHATTTNNMAVAWDQVQLLWQTQLQYETTHAHVQAPLD